MGLLKIVKLFLALFIATYLFCWLFTSNWIFGPVVTVVSFLGGILLLGILGVSIIRN